MTKSNIQSVLHRHFIVWFIALFVFAFLEWRHTGFVSYVFPFPVLVCVPGIILLGGLLVKVVTAFMFLQRAETNEPL